MSSFENLLGIIFARHFLFRVNKALIQVLYITVNDGLEATEGHKGITAATNIFEKKCNLDYFLFVFNVLSDF